MSERYTVEMTGAASAMPGPLWWVLDNGVAVILTYELHVAQQVSRLMNRLWLTSGALKEIVKKKGEPGCEGCYQAAHDALTEMGHQGWHVNRLKPTVAAEWFTRLAEKEA